ncbi:MAG: hypothetical protein ACFCUI_04640 [Bernardetiaceae bacterium]
MKNIKFFFTLSFLCLMLASFTMQTTELAPQGNITFNIKNDTKENVRIYDGKGHFTINRGSSRRTTVEAGRKFYKSESGKKGALLFEASSDLNGKTVSLSKHW